jgi:ribonucleoside-diphosphate reductase alpha chain
MGPHAGYSDNVEPMNRVLRMHRDAVNLIDETLVPLDLLSAAQEAWDHAVEMSATYGTRNAQATVLAPTGTIGLLMDCDTTGVEPDLGLVKFKKLVGGGNMQIVNQTVPRALKRLGYTPSQVEEIIAYIDVNKTIVGAPHLLATHLNVFACSMGDNVIHHTGHVRMMAAVQPFLSGAISKTVNMPEDATIEDIEQIHIDAWKMGIKAVAIYRDNCKVGQPLSTMKKDSPDAAGDTSDQNVGSVAADPALAAKVAELEEMLAATTTVVRTPVRERLPRRRRSTTSKFRVADCEGFVTVGEFEDGRPGELFIKVSKQGSTLAGIMDAFSLTISLGLQHGVPLTTYVSKFASTRFEPAGMTDDPEIRITTSLVDYIFRRLALDYLTYEQRLDLGVLSVNERTQPTLPGMEEAVTKSTNTLDITSAGSATSAAPSSVPTSPSAPIVQNTISRQRPADAPFCYSCGNEMNRAGSCYVCSACGTTSGCS